MPNYYPIALGRRSWRGIKPKRRHLEKTGDMDRLFEVQDPESAITPKDYEATTMATTFTSISDHWDDIFKLLSTQDQISLCCVSRTVRDAAAKQLYRKFHIFFPDEDETDSESESDEPYCDALAGGLNTFATSSYNYAQYIKEIVLESQCGGAKGERAYVDYHYDMSCGKFLNTLLHLTLLKATSLQIFKWDVRVELSRDVYKTLHKMDTLTHVHLRMQDGPSLSTVGSVASSSSGLFTASSSPELQVPPPPPYIPALANQAGLVILVGKHPSKHNKLKERTSRTQTVVPTIAGFKGLNSLAILDLDTMNYAEEIKQCLDNSSLDLRHLRLSFSEQLANRAKKPTPEPQPDEDSDMEDEFGQTPLLPGPPGGPPGLLPVMVPSGAADPNGPTRELKAQEEKIRQDAFLAKVLGREKEEAEAKKKTEQLEKETSLKEDEAKEMFHWLKNLVHSTGFGSARQETLFRSMGKALEYYNNRLKEELQEAESAKSVAGPSKAVRSKEKPVISATPPKETTAAASGAADDGTPSLFAEAKDVEVTKPDSDVAKPEDINVEQPEEETTSNDLPASESGDDETSNGSNGNEIKDQEEKSAEKKAQEWPSLTVKLKDNDGESSKAAAAPATKEEQTREYIRSTRGLTLDSVAICLIPVHGVALTKSIDLSVLTDLTLLSVGPQAYFWVLMAEENIKYSLPLNKIYTDDVSWSFLSLMNQLQRVDELLLLQRQITKKGPRQLENVAEQTNVKIKDIRRLILKKHVKTLRILMIRNNTGSRNWDLDVDTTQLLCSRAEKLEELAVSFGMRVMHTLLQSMPNLSSLRVLHITRFDCHDNSVTCDLRKFAVENVANNPDMKLEYFALDNMLERIVRKKPETVDTKGKGKQVAKKHKNDGKVVILANGHWIVGNPLHVYPLGAPHHTAPVGPAGLDWGTDSDDDEEAPNRSKVETVSDLRFAHVMDVRIFEKEVMLGRL
ncbi:hypothetical protein BJ878DRAFT_73868 [Calycina marina]|uniref:F-box domain-containing protein n=1 Tax=Calycina marina TaxID=1763456 RepID=A0A9P8CEQ5_9HELO|nr:hypothetical protein BJ878DRAFT_73868 [Calycina marina]